MQQPCIRSRSQTAGSCHTQSYKLWNLLCQAHYTFCWIYIQWLVMKNSLREDGAGERSHNIASAKYASSPKIIRQYTAVPAS